MSYREDGPPFATLAHHYAAQPIGALGIMHTSLARHRGRPCRCCWSRRRCRVMVYPEAGYFQAPDWQFVEVEPAALADAAMGWVARGVRIVGGCCGLGPAHIAAMAAAVTGGHSMATGPRER